ncbi:MAG TPA: CoA pyrophosphatase [Geobacteraceae bacterium]
MITLDDISLLIACHEPTLIPPDARTASAVALVLREEQGEVHVLFVERATRPGDPWSGDIGFPGGKVEAEDEGPQQAAERETREEIGLDLRTGRFLGRLSDITGAHLPVLVSCFIYAVSTTEPFTLSDELSDAFWVPLAELQAPERHIVSPVLFRGETMDRPAIALPVSGKPLLWGITYRLVMEFLRLAGGGER